MSRTDVHRPFLVQGEDPYNRHRMQFLPEYSDGSGGLRPWPLYNICGCNLCTQQFWRKYLRRQERMAWRTVRQRLLKTQAADREDMDWYTPFPTAAW